MSSFVDNLKNLNEKGCQCLYTAGSGPQRQIRVFPASALKMVVIEDSLNNRRFNIRHFANHYARHNNQWDPYPTNLEEILENITVERGDDAGVRLMEALKTFDAERLKFLGRDDLYVNRIQPYLERVAAAEKLQKVAIVQELYTVLQEPKVMGFANRNPKFKETMMAKAEELRALHYLEFPELNKHLEMALRAYGQEPKVLVPTPDAIVLAHFATLPDGIQVRIQAYDFLRCDWGILYPSRQTLYCHQLRCELSLLVFFDRFIDNNNDIRMFETRPTTLKEFLENMYINKGATSLFERLKTWTKANEADLTIDTPAEMISRFYSFRPELDIPACAPDCNCGGALEEEASCDCHRCTVEDELRGALSRLEGQLKSAIKRIQLLEEHVD